MDGGSGRGQVSQLLLDVGESRVGGEHRMSSSGSMSLHERGQLRCVLQGVQHHRQELGGQASAGVVVVVAGWEGGEGSGRDLVHVKQVLRGSLFAAEHLLAQAAWNLG